MREEGTKKEEKNQKQTQQAQRFSAFLKIQFPYKTTCNSLGDVCSCICNRFVLIFSPPLTYGG